MLYLIFSSGGPSRLMLGWDVSSIPRENLFPVCLVRGVAGLSISHLPLVLGVQLLTYHQYYDQSHNFRYLIDENIVGLSISQWLPCPLAIWNLLFGMAILLNLVKLLSQYIIIRAITCAERLAVFSCMLL